MAVLVCLGRHAPGVVSKERLLEEVWSDSPYVGDDAISHAVWELRKALGDSARDPAYIRTVPRKGYRLVAEILRPQGSPLPIAGVRIDHYDLAEELGRGAMGVVYEATDRRLGRNVAIKFLAPELTRDPKACQRFEREARLAASLEHPNLATVHEIGETSDGHRYLVSAYYRGGSLKDLLAAGPLEVPEVLRLVRQLLAGLGAAHQRGIIHRDVKPANLLLDDHGTLKICDFGIAKLLGATDLTRTGTPLGTPAYKSPEQTLGRAVDHRTDLWSAGVVCFELLTGRRPFDGELEQAVAHSILVREPEVLEDARGRRVPERLRRFVARAMAKDPEERFQSAEEMAAELDRLAGDSADPGGSWRFRATGFGIGAVLLALGMVGYWSWTSRAPAPTPSATVGVAGTGETAARREGLDRLAQGRTLWLRGNHRANLREVREHFEKAVELMPESAGAQGHLAAFLAESHALGSKQDGDRARELIQRTLAADPGSALARAAESWLRVMDRQPKAAERLAREALEIWPDCDDEELCDLAYLWLAQAVWTQDRTEEALTILDAGTRVGGGRIRCRLKRAQLYERSGQMKKAEEEYLEVLDLDKTQTTALYELANYYLKARQFSEAVPLLNRLYKTTEDPNALNSWGYALYEQELWDLAIGRYQEAHRVYQAAGRLVPTPLMAIGDVYLEQGMTTDARHEYRRALDVFEAIEQPSLMRQAQRAVCLAKLGDLDRAVEEIERLLGDVEHGVEYFPDLLLYAARIYALKGEREVLLDLARQWAERGQKASRFLDDPAFIPYRKDHDYRRTLEPQLIPAE